MRIAVLADTHLGWSAGHKTDPKSGVNARVLDGYRIFGESIDQILSEHEKNAFSHLIHAGDLFHNASPGVMDVVVATREMRRLAMAGIKIVIIAGNHDVPGNRSKPPAILALEDTHRNIDAIVQPLREIELEDEVFLHGLTHLGLMADGPIPQPKPGAVNILTSHGAVALPGHPLFAILDTYAERVIGAEIVSDPGWNAVLLGHYHTRESLPGLPHAWYAGSAFRRGFSDLPGERGWLDVTINSSGKALFHTHNTWQRDQYDLPIIDATGMTADDIRMGILGQLSMINAADAIVRQIVTETTPGVWGALDLQEINSIVAPAMSWQLVCRHAGQENDLLGSDSLKSAGKADLSVAWREFASRRASIPSSMRQAVVTRGLELLASASEKLAARE